MRRASTAVTPGRAAAAGPAPVPGVTLPATLLVVLLALLPITAVAGCSRGNPGSLTTSGAIQATEIPIAAEVAGKIDDVLVREGDAVRKGDVVASLEATALALQLKQAEAALGMAEARLAEARAGARPEQVRQAEQTARQAAASLDGARKSYDRTVSLYSQGAVSRAQLDAAITQLEAAEAAAKASQAQADLVRKGPSAEQMRQIESAVEQASVAVDLATFNLDRTTVRAPAAGTVTRRLVEPGALVAAGSTIAALIDPEDLWLRVYVPENRLGLVNLNGKVDVEVDSYPGRCFEAEVVHIADKAEFTPRNVQTKEERVTTVFAVKLRLLEGLGGELKPGMPADVTFRSAATGGE